MKDNLNEANTVAKCSDENPIEETTTVKRLRKEYEHGLDFG